MSMHEIVGLFVNRDARRDWTIEKGPVRDNAMGRVLTIAHHELSAPGFEVTPSMPIQGLRDELVIYKRFTDALKAAGPQVYTLFESGRNFKRQPIGTALVVTGRQWLGDEPPEPMSYLWCIALRKDRQGIGFGRIFTTVIAENEAANGSGELWLHARDEFAAHLPRWFPGQVTYTSEAQEFFPGIGAQQEFHIRIAHQ